MMSWYELRLDMDDNQTFLVTSPDFPEVTTFGEDMDAAMVNGRMAIEEAIAFRISRGDVIPAPRSDDDGGKYAVQMSLLVFFKSALYMICKGKDVSRAELARQLNWHREQVDRLFRLDHNSRLDQLEAAFKVMEIDIHVPIPEFTAQVA